MSAKSAQSIAVKKPSSAVPRVFIGIVFLAAGLGVQVAFLSAFTWVIGIILVIIGCVFVVPKGASNAPVRKGKHKNQVAWEFKTDSGPKLFTMGDWAEIDKNQLGRIESLFKINSKSSNSFSTCCLLFLAIASLIGWFIAAPLFDPNPLPSWVSFVCPNGFIFLLAFAIGGGISAWEPPGLRLKLKVYWNILPFLEKIEGLEVKPQAKYYEAVDGPEKVPYDLQVKANWSGAPKELYGVQFQVSQNSVQGTSYPYFYAVIVAAKGFHLKQKLRGLLLPKPDVTEYSSEDDVEIVVLRQDPDAKPLGYLTHENDQRRLTVGALKTFDLLRPAA